MCDDVIPRAAVAEMVIVGHDGEEVNRAGMVL